VKGIEPSYSAWKAAALPLSYTRAGRDYALAESPLQHARTPLVSLANVTAPQLVSLARLQEFSVVPGPWSPGEIVGENINRNGRQKYQNAEPEKRRMMDAPPVAPIGYGLLPFSSMLVFFVHWMFWQAPLPPWLQSRNTLFERKILSETALYPGASQDTRF
jgi:hypothetical protein